MIKEFSEEIHAGRTTQVKLYYLRINIYETNHHLDSR
jgi:hypothetical protein